MLPFFSVAVTAPSFVFVHVLCVFAFLVFFVSCSVQCSHCCVSIFLFTDLVLQTCCTDTALETTLLTRPSPSSLTRFKTRCWMECVKWPPPGHSLRRNPARCRFVLKMAWTWNHSMMFTPSIAGRRQFDPSSPHWPPIATTVCNSMPEALNHEVRPSRIFLALHRSATAPPYRRTGRTATSRTSAPPTSDCTLAW